MAKRNAKAMRKIYVGPAFTLPADQNYLMARIAFGRGLIFDGYWAAALATEKYLKASLLLNGCPALSAHGLIDLFDKLRSQVPLALVPGELIPPFALSGLERFGNWGTSSTRYFVSHLEVYGGPDNRYGRSGYHFDHYVLPELDHLVYFLRRNCRTLNAEDASQRDLTNWKLGGAVLLETHLEKNGLRITITDWSTTF